VVYASAKTGRRVSDILPAAVKVDEARRKRIPTAALNKVIRRAVEDHPPPIRKGKQFKVLYAAQGKERTPTIVLFVNDPEAESLLVPALPRESNPRRLRLRGRTAADPASQAGRRRMTRGVR